LALGFYKVLRGGEIVQLIIIFAERLGLALLPRFPLAAFRVDGVPYVANEADDRVLVFHDRLLDAEGQLAGILLWCFPQDGIDAALRVLPRARPYLVRDPSSSPSVARYEVHFRELSSTEAEQLVSDGGQSLADRIYWSPDGELAIAVELDDVLGAGFEGEKDLARMRALTADWPVISEVVKFREAEA
jgi:hypothetical protein